MRRGQRARGGDRRSRGAGAAARLGHRIEMRGARGADREEGDGSWVSWWAAAPWTRARGRKGRA